MIIVSGATGFLGAHIVCELLAQGKTVRAMKRERSSLAEFELIFNYRFRQLPGPEKEKLKAALHWVTADVLDVSSLDEALKGANEVYHAAAMVSFHQADLKYMMNVNVQGTANMLNLALINKVGKFCHISSIAALGRVKSGSTIDELAHWEDSELNSNYSISKHKAEMEVWRAKEEGLNVCVLNPGVILGVGDFSKGSINLFQSIYKGMPFYSNGINGYVDVEDVAKAARMLMDAGIFGQRFVMVSGCISFKKLLFDMADGLKRKRPGIEVGPILAEISWRLGVMLKPLGLLPVNVTKETARASQKVYYYRNEKIQQVIPFGFKALSQTIAEVCDYYLAENANGSNSFVTPPNRL